MTFFPSIFPFLLCLFYLIIFRLRKTKSMRCDECVERGCRGTRWRQCCVDGNRTPGRFFYWGNVGICQLTKERGRGRGGWRLLSPVCLYYCTWGKTFFYFCQSAKEMRVRACGAPWLWMHAYGLHYLFIPMRIFFFLLKMFATQAFAYSDHKCVLKRQHLDIPCYLW